MYVILLHTESKFACQGQHNTINLFILFTRDWSPKFETGLNIIIGIVQKV